jgi:hypothetical protein
MTICALICWVEVALRVARGDVESISEEARSYYHDPESYVIIEGVRALLSRPRHAVTTSKAALLALFL